MKKYFHLIPVFLSITISSVSAQSFSVTITGPVDSICAGTQITFAAEVVYAGTSPSYQWKLNGTDAGTNSSSYSNFNLQDGDIVSCVATNTSLSGAVQSAISNSIRIMVKEEPAPLISIAISENPFCEGSQITLTATTTNAGNSPSYEWQNQTQHVGSNDPVFNSSQFADGDQIDCLLKPDNPKCYTVPVLSNIITVHVLPVPRISITGNTITTSPGSVQLNANVTGDPKSIVWSPANSLNNSTILDPIANPIYTTKYTLQITDQDGCKAQADYTIKIDRKLSIPNAFTPNGDGVNDVFRVLYGSDFSQITFAVYNRWGQLVFIDHGSNKSWDGKNQPAGTYIWYFSYRDQNGIQNTLKGTVQLIR